MLVLEVMLDLLALRKINGILSNVCRQVGDALEIPAHEEKLEGRTNVARALHHVREHHTEYGIVKRIDCVICHADFTSECSISAQECVESVAQHRAGAARHIL